MTLLWKGVADAARVMRIFENDMRRKKYKYMLCKILFEDVPFSPKPPNFQKFAPEEKPHISLNSIYSYTVIAHPV